MMALSRVTLSGIDDDVDIQDLIHLAQHFPFVEYGILFHLDKTGREHRYPSLRRIREFTSRLAGLCSIHLCGQLAVHVIEGSIYPFYTVSEIAGNFSRLQINGSHLLPVFPQSPEKISKISCNFVFNCILQVRSFDDKAVKLFNGQNLTFIEDVSRGTGLKSPFTSPPEKYTWSGVAGGVTPETVKERIQEAINLRKETQYFWIDSETGVRTDNKFDIDKASYVLEKSQPFITRRGG